MAVSDNNGKKAITNYKILQVFSNKNLPKISLIEFNLKLEELIKLECI